MNDANVPRNGFVADGPARLAEAEEPERTRRAAMSRPEDSRTPDHDGRGLGAREPGAPEPRIAPDARILRAVRACFASVGRSAGNLERLFGKR